MSAGQALDWIVWPIVVPLLAAPLLVLLGRRSLPWPAIAASAGIGAGLIGLTAELRQTGPIRHAVGGWGAPLGIELYADGLSLLMLWMTAAVGTLVSVYALGYLRREPAAAQAFWPLWLLLWAALNALYLSADVFNLYVTLELLTLAAIPLVILAGSAAALAAGMRYLLLALLGSLAYLLGVALLYGSYATLDLAQLGRLVAPGPAAWAAIALMTLGLITKTALFPLHVWLPPAHSSAPAPVSALLSSLVVKGSFYVLLRLWFDVFPAALTPAADQLLGALGAAAILCGSVQALREARLKLLVAYSTVAQLGYLLLLFPLRGALAGDGVVLHTLSHALAKAALFLAAGNVLLALGHDRIRDLSGWGRELPLTLSAVALAGIAIMGLPPSGSFLAKWLLLEAALASGQWWWMAVILAGGLLAAGYLFRVLARAFAAAPGAREPAARLPRVLEQIPLCLALLALALGFAATPALGVLAIGAPFVRAELAP